MSTKRVLTEDEIKKIAIDYVNKNPSKEINFKFASIKYTDTDIYPKWSVVFEMLTEKGEYIDGPLVLGINEYGEIILVG